MTIIVALNDKNNNQIIVGTDTQTTYGQMKIKTDTKIINKKVKITDKNNQITNQINITLAICGRAYMKNFIKYGFDTPNMKENMSFIEYLHKEFLPKLTEELTNNKLVQVDNSQVDSEIGMLVIYNDKIFKIESNFGIINDSHLDYVTLGSGDEVALGSLRTSLKLNPLLDSEVHVKQAIQAAGELTIYCNSDVKLTRIKY